MLEYACQRLYRDARITSIYEGTTQLQTVAALPHITTGSYTLMLEELEAMDVRPEYESIKARVKAMDAKFNEAVEYVKSVENNEFTDLCSRHLYELAAACVMSQLLLRDAPPGTLRQEHEGLREPRRSRSRKALQLCDGTQGRIDGKL